MLSEFSALSAHKGMPKVFTYSIGELIILHLNFSVTRNENFKCVYLKMTFLNLIDRFDSSLSVRLAYLTSRFIRDFYRYGTT